MTETKKGETPRLAQHTNIHAAQARTRQPRLAVSTDVSIPELAGEATGFTGSELEYWCTVAASLAWIRINCPAGSVGAAPSAGGAVNCPAGSAGTSTSAGGADVGSGTDSGSGSAGVGGIADAQPAVQDPCVTQADFAAAMYRVRCIRTVSSMGTSPALPDWSQIGGYATVKQKLRHVVVSPPAFPLLPFFLLTCSHSGGCWDHPSSAHLAGRSTRVVR